jgi:GH35 family endo-1,4-beta-xylanase
MFGPASTFLSEGRGTTDRSFPQGDFFMFKLKAAFGGLLALACLSGAASAQIAAGKSKWIGNVSNSSSVPSSFATYWNQMTPENATKWGSVEGTRNSMNWGTADALYAYAQQRGYPFKFHTFVWGSQYPSWLTSLSTTEQRAEIEQWIQLSCQRFPNMWGIDVVNEPIKTAMPFKAALGGDGSTGWDWVITSFQLARQYCPNAKLLINEYGTENDPGPRATYKTIINLLKARGLIDGIGIQAHYFNVDNMTGSAVTSMLNDYATTSTCRSSTSSRATPMRASSRNTRTSSRRSGRTPTSRASRSGVTSSARPGAMARAC